MPIISTEILKITDERKRCDTRCVVMRWSNSKMQSRQYKMPIISVTDNKNNRWKRNTHTKNNNSNNNNNNKTKKQTKKQQNKGDRSYSEWVTDKRFCWALKLGFLQLICKAEIYNGRIWCSFTQTKIIQK